MRIVLVILLTAIAILLIAAISVVLVYFQPSYNKATKLDEASCKSLLSSYDSTIGGLKYDEVQANRYLNFSTGSVASTWKINNTGNVIAEWEFLPNIPTYQFRVFFVWIGDEFEGCGLHYTFYNQTNRKFTFKNHYTCTGGGIEGGYREIYMEKDEGKAYYMIAYELISEFEASTKTTYHITFSNNPSDLQNGLNLLQMYGCG
jgi:hypothetical protein